MKFCMKIRRGWLVYVECVELVLISLTDSGHIFCMCIRSGRLDYVKMTASILLFFVSFSFLSAQIKLMLRAVLRTATEFQSRELARCRALDNFLA